MKKKSTIDKVIIGILVVIEIIVITLLFSSIGWETVITAIILNLIYDKFKDLYNHIKDEKEEKH